MELRRLALFLGPALFLLCAFANFGLEKPAQLTLGITFWIAVWWILEPVPLAITSLLPLILFPITGVMPLKTAAAEFSNEIIYLFLAGFILGKAVEKWGLHRRIALSMVARMGSQPGMILLGFMASTAFISMWISNTATAIMMLPVALAIVGKKELSAENDGPKSSSNFSKSLMLGIGYAASIGGMATVIGTPTNAIFVSFVKQNLPDEAVSFGKWLAFGLPFATILLLICWLILKLIFPLHHENAVASRAVIQTELAALGNISAPERRVLLVFSLVVFGWISGSLFWYEWFPKTLGVGDAIVALTGVLALFLWPAQGFSREKLMDWQTAERIPWSIILLFGGGLALAKGFEVSGLALFLGQKMVGLGSLPFVLMLFGILAATVLLSEVASNIATASMMMPVLFSLAGAIGVHPFGLLLSATLAASVGFMLPIATAPNSIAFSSGHLSTRDMMRAGFWLDLAAILLLVAFVYWVMPLAWGISLR